MTELHGELSSMLTQLSRLIAHRFEGKARQDAHVRYTKRIKAIAGRTYESRDRTKVQTRIRNQGTNLLTALLFENVPFTNNHVERQIRPMAVTRKISVGSQSSNGVAIHAVLMSKVQTMSLKGQNIMEALPKILATPAHRYAVVSGKDE